MPSKVASKSWVSGYPGSIVLAQQVTEGWPGLRGPAQVVTKEECMISNVIIACSATCSVHAQSHDQCMISFVISAWSAK